MDNPTEIVYAWQKDTVSVTACWEKREITAIGFKTLFSEIQERGGIVSATTCERKEFPSTIIWRVVVRGDCKDILINVFRSGTVIVEEGEAPPIFTLCSGLEPSLLKKVKPRQNDDPADVDPQLKIGQQE